MSVYHESLYHTIDHKTYTVTQMNFMKNEKNIYHNILNQFSIKKTVQNKDNVKNEINFNENTVKTANFIVVDSELVSLKICHKCQTKFNIRNQLH